VARNPLRSEAEAFRFVLLTVAYFALIVAAAAVNTWLGLAVFLVLTALVLWRWLRKPADEAPLRVATTSMSAEGERRILVVANETVGGRELLDVLRAMAAGVQEHVLVVTPALNSPVRHWTSDDDAARVAAQARLDRSLAQLARDGIDARGEVGDGDPLQAIEDALRTFGADEIVISTHPVGRSHWLERHVVEEARARFDVPITHVVVDLEREALAEPEA
jgi:GABA permease